MKEKLFESVWRFKFTILGFMSVFGLFKFLTLDGELAHEEFNQFMVVGVLGIIFVVCEFVVNGFKAMHRNEA